MFCCSSIAAVVLTAFLGSPTAARAAGTYLPFEGKKTAWHDGFDRNDFVMDEETLAIKPFNAPEGEKYGVKDPAKGQRRCIVIVPKQLAPGQPWSWRGFHVAYTSANATLRPGKEWDAWYAFLTEQHGLPRKPAFIGMSRGGEYAYTWATANPNKVSCIYRDNPGASRELMMKFAGLATNDVPLLHVCGSIDPLLGKKSTAIEGRYKELGGPITVMIRDGEGHYPLGPKDPKPAVDFIVGKAN